MPAMVLTKFPSRRSTKSNARQIPNIIRKTTGVDAVSNSPRKARATYRRIRANFVNPS